MWASRVPMKSARWIFSLVQLISLIIKLIITLNKNVRGQKVPLILIWDIRKHVLRQCSAICLCPITSLYIHKILRRHYEELLVFQVLSWCTLNFSWETWKYMVWCWKFTTSFFRANSVLGFTNDTGVEESGEDK